MPRKPKQHPGSLTFDPFFGQWASEIRSAQANEKIALGIRAVIKGDFRRASADSVSCYADSPEMWDAVQKWWPIRLLRRMAEAEDKEAYKRFLNYLLLRLNAKPPKRVILNFAWPPGRRSDARELIEAAGDKKHRGEEISARARRAIARARYPEEYEVAIKAESAKPMAVLLKRVDSAIRRRSTKRTEVS